MDACIDHGRKRPGYAQARRVLRDGKLRHTKLHILALEAATGEMADGRLALHHCDNTRCINPTHLYWGDHAQNMKDRSVRGRTKGPPRKLLAEEVCKIRKSGKYKDHAVAYGLSLNALWQIRHSRTYKDVICDNLA